MIFIRKNAEMYDSTIEMNQLYTVITISLIFLLILIIVLVIEFRSNMKKKITGKTGNDGTKDAEIMVPLKYLSNFWSTLEKTVNCEINHILT